MAGNDKKKWRVTFYNDRGDTEPRHVEIIEADTQEEAVEIVAQLLRGRLDQCLSVDVDPIN